MANQPSRRRNRISLPGHSSGMSRDELRNVLFGKAPSTSSVAPEFIMNEVKAVQECGHSESANLNIAKPEADMSQKSPLVSKHGQKVRNHFKNCGSNPVSDETSPGHFSEERKMEFVHTDGPGGTHDDNIESNTNFGQRSSVYPNKFYLQRQQDTSCNQSEDCQLNSHYTNVLQPQQDLNAAKEHASERNEEESSYRTHLSSSFVITDNESHFSDSLKGLLNSSIRSKSWRDSIKSNEKLEDLINGLRNQEGSEALEELINSVQTKRSLQNQEDSELDIEQMLMSLLKHSDLDMTSLRSFILMYRTGFNKEKNSLQQPSGQMSPLVPLENEIINILRAECHEPQCLKGHCVKVQQCLSRLEDTDVLVTDLTSEEQNVLRCMYDHCRSCEYLHCPLYWCQREAFYSLSDPKEHLAKMKELAEYGYHPNFLEDLREGYFVKFLHGLPWTDVPREPEDWIGMCRLPRANNTIFAGFDSEEGMEYWIIKKCRMYESLSQMDLYETLREISHEGIALHLWTKFCPDQRYMAVCVEYEEFSLNGRLQESPLKTLPVVVRIMLQLIRTTQYLHEKGILYLNWSSRNIVYRTPEHFKLTNFTCSALKTRIKEDIKDISLSLPRYLITPEMLETYPKVDETTDVWGLGCLLKEILSGQPVWSEYLHESNSVLQKKIMTELPSKPHDCLDLVSTFRACWERQRSLRPSLDELEMFLVQATKDKKM